MPTIQHSALTTTDLHEPKGVATATAGQMYVADGAGSGAWTSPAYGGIFTSGSDAVTVGTIGTTVKKFAGFAQNNPATNVTPDNANDNLTALLAGDYQIIFNCSISTVASGDSGIYQFHVRINDVEQTIGVHRFMSGTNDVGSIACQGIKTLAVNDVVTIWVESDAGGDNDDINVIHASLSIIKVG